ncbi:olfactory receptor 148-like [Suncus etruscus]|uniref:olfactory receptor 148-like n=1 Tax=Suncus etruscus TaxID=109475 RepID=UPI00211040E7|nr:olfactory receptor 148-like [Suncus etruscus]
MRNHTELTEFILLGIPQTQGVETMLFPLFLVIYLFTLIGNLLILTAIVSYSVLHTPMYFFLGLLAILDIVLPAVTCPKMLIYLSGQSRAISYNGCATQIFFYHFLGCTEACLYSVMSYDRFVAICYPLRYSLIMRPGVCVGLVIAAWTLGFVHASILTAFTFSLTYCGPNHVDYFFCDIPAVLPLACDDTSLAQAVGSAAVSFLVLLFWSIIFLCYLRIAIAILQMRSAEGRKKAFSTCSAHLAAVLCYLAPVVIIYLQPTPNPLVDATVQIFTNIVSPMLNSLIFSLRNKDVKTSLKKVFCKYLLRKNKL